MALPVPSSYSMPLLGISQILVTLFEVELRRRETAVLRIQGLSRMSRARERARELVFAQYEKRFDVYTGLFYYHSSKTSVNSFIKPRVLRPEQVSTEMSNRSQ